MITIRAATSPGEIRIAVFDDDIIQDLCLWRPGRPDGIDDVYRARITAHLPGMAGAFLSLPDRDGFLPDSEGGAGVLEGALLTVRITRAGQGGKGARLSAKLPQTEGPPGLVARGPNPIELFAAQHPGAPIEVDDPALAAELRRHAPTIVPVDLDDVIDALAARQTDLPGGMRATFEPTQALVAIDLDMAAATQGRQAKPAAQLAANLAALPELARQIRLRNLSGAIFVDPAGMSTQRRPLLAQALAAALASDPLHPHLLGFTKLGLAEIVRPRIRPPLHELLRGPHAAALAAHRTIARESAATPHATLGLTAAPDVINALDQDEVALADLARRTGRPLIPKPEPALPPGTWRIERRA